LTKGVATLGLFPVTIDVLIAELLVSQSQVAVIALLVFVDLILLISLIFAVYQRDRRYSKIRKSLIPLEEPSIVERAKIILTKFKVSQINIYMTKSDRFRGPPALAVGISRPSLWFSDRMLNGLSPSEVGEIIGHELAHLVERHRIKILVIGFLYTLTGLNLILFTASGMSPPLSLLFLIGGLILILAGSVFVIPYLRRSFEFKADEVAAHILGNPSELASALSKLNEMLSRSSHGSAGRWRKWRASHPPMSERVSRLRQLSKA
jgi:Zn-dependent protease with chaperone function